MKLILFTLVFSLSLIAQAHYAVVGTDIVRDEFKLTHLRVDLRKDFVDEQSSTLKNEISFQTALRDALNNFLNDDTHVESPLALVTDFAFEELGVKPTFPVPAIVRQKAKKILFNYLNRPSTTLRLLSLTERPENDESVSENWIFQLDISELSDHRHWAVVDRSAKKKTYNYGFN